VKRRWIAVVACLAVAGGMLAWSVGRGLDREVPVATKPSGQAYGMKLVNSSRNISCRIMVKEGSAELQIIPPTDIDRLMVIRDAKTGHFLSFNREDGVAVHKHVPTVITANPRTMIVYTFDEATWENRPVKLAQHDGEYDFLISDSFDEDWEYNTPQAWCIVRIWRR
jgi:hypothetical protein